MSFIAKALEKHIPIEQIDTLMTPRIESIRNTVQQLNDAGIRKTCLYVDLAASLRQTEGEAQSVRRAKALVYHLEHVDTPIYEGEQLIGSVTGMWAVDPERSKTPYAQLRALILRIYRFLPSLSRSWDWMSLRVTLGCCLRRSPEHPL